MFDRPSFRPIIDRLSGLSRGSETWRRIGMGTLDEIERRQRAKSEAMIGNFSQTKVSWTRTMDQSGKRRGIVMGKWRRSLHAWSFRLLDVDRFHEVMAAKSSQSLIRENATIFHKIKIYLMNYSTSAHFYVRLSSNLSFLPKIFANWYRARIFWNSRIYPYVMLHKWFMMMFNRAGAETKYQKVSMCDGSRGCSAESCQRRTGLFEWCKQLQEFVLEASQFRNS